MKVSLQLPMYPKIEDGAIFIADSHFSKKNDELVYFLEKIKKKEIYISQLFLMGDIFDFISQESKYFIKINKIVIDLLNTISKDVKITYLEGNHDFNLKGIFKNIKIVRLEEQPIYFRYQDKKIALSHGDNFTSWKYMAYSKIIRNSIFLKFLNFLDVNYFISKKIENMLHKKSICHKIEKFRNIVEKRVYFYNSDVIIEGHYHQGDKFLIDGKLYINIPSLTCQKEYVKLVDNSFIKENLYG